MHIVVEALNTRAVATKFERMGTRAVDARPALEIVADMMMGYLDKNFQAQGRRGGGSWKDITPKWRAYKERHDLDPRLNHATLALRNAMTQRGDDNQILEVTRNSVWLGADLPYAEERDSDRPFAYFLDSDVRAMRTVIRDHLMAVWRARSSRTARRASL